VRWSPGNPTQILALRDELTTRAFDDPGEWWPELPDVIGGRDQVAGGTWCASRVGTGVTALVLNRPQKRAAKAAAPSRVLPLLAVEHEQDWTAHLDPEGMASFALVLVTPARVTTWDFDGVQLTETSQGAGTHMVTSGGIEDGKAERYLDAFRRAADAGEWRRLIRRDAPSTDLTELVVRRERDGMVYATVFGQLIESEPGRLSLQHSRTPWRDDGWEALTRRS
jgi:hypothetical protein